jgi:hypothetical protein
VLEWSRFFVWSGYDLVTGATTALVLQCPEDKKLELVEAFGKGLKAEMLKNHPMMLHAFFMEGIVLKARRFSQDLTDPIYNWVSSLISILSFCEKECGLTTRLRIGIWSGRLTLGKRFHRPQPCLLDAQQTNITSNNRL